MKHCVRGNRLRSATIRQELKINPVAQEERICLKKDGKNGFQKRVTEGFQNKYSRINRWVENAWKYRGGEAGTRKDCLILEQLAMTTTLKIIIIIVINCYLQMMLENIATHKWFGTMYERYLFFNLR